MQTEAPESKLWPEKTTNRERNNENIVTKIRIRAIEAEAKRRKNEQLSQDRGINVRHHRCVSVFLHEKLWYKNGCRSTCYLFEYIYVIVVHFLSSFRLLLPFLLVFLFYITFLRHAHMHTCSQCIMFISFDIPARIQSYCQNEYSKETITWLLLFLY